MSTTATEELFRTWHRPWKERVCERVLPFSHGTVLRSPRYPGYWEYNCIRLDRPMGAEELIAAADRELDDCVHRFVEWTIPIPADVAAELRERGWMVEPLIFMLHDGRELPQSRVKLVDVDYDAVRELRDIWHREDFGDNIADDEFRAQAREVAERADARVLAAVREDRPVGFAQVETHDGGSEVAQVFVHPQHRGGGLGQALTTQAIRIARGAAPHVWICAERDGRPRRLYERLGFRPAVETGVTLRLPADPE